MPLLRRASFNTITFRFYPWVCYDLPEIEHAAMPLLQGKSPPTLDFVHALSVFESDIIPRPRNRSFPQLYDSCFPIPSRSVPTSITPSSVLHPVSPSIRFSPAAMYTRIPFFTFNLFSLIRLLFPQNPTHPSLRLVPSLTASSCQSLRRGDRAWRGGT